LDPTETDDTNDDTTTGAEGGGEAAEPSLLDAVSAALEPTTPVVPSDDTSAAEENEDGADELDPNEEPEEEGEAGEGDKPRGADGKFIEAGDKGKVGKGGEKAGEGDGKPDGKKQPDVVNDPIPEDVKGRTRERMQGLIDTVKSKDEIIANQHTIIEAVKATGATPDDFSGMIRYMGWYYSDDPAQLTKARDLLQQQLEEVSIKLGQPAAGTDFISRYADIKEQLEAGQITPEAALELSMSRAARDRTKARTDAANQQAEAETAAKTERETAISDLDQLGKTLQQTDPDYARKHAVLKPILNSLGMLPPKQWKAAFMKAYKAVKLEPVQTQQGTQQNTPKGQPLRANKSPSAGQNRQPTSLFDAISSAVDSVGQ